MGREKKKPAATGDAVFDALLASSKKKYGAGIVFDMSKRDITDIPRLTTGSLTIDRALGGRGLPRGRIIEVYGPESSGKTTFCLNVVREAQQDPEYLAEGRRVLYIDAEHALDFSYARNGIGVDPSKIIISQPDHGEQALQIADEWIRTGKISLVVIDSVSTLVPKKELEGEMGDSHVGLQARLMSQALRKLTGLCNQTNTIVIFINQIRMKIGVMFGSPETTSGGNALKFYASQRLDIRRTGTVKDTNGKPIINHTRVKVVKNKVAPPYGEAEFDIRFGDGIDSAGECLDLGIEFGLIHKSGAWYSLPSGERLGQGREKTIASLKEDQELFYSLRNQLIDILFQPSFKSRNRYRRGYRGVLIVYS